MAHNHTYLCGSGYGCDQEPPLFQIPGSSPVSPMDLPTPGKYLAADGTTKPRSGSFWWEVGKLKNKPRFPKLFHLMAGFLSIHLSNANSERGFSILSKIHSDQRSNLNQSIIIAFMTLKFNENCCHDNSFRYFSPSVRRLLQCLFKNEKH